MDRARDELFSSARFAAHEDGDRRRGGAPDELPDLVHRGRLADEGLVVREELGRRALRVLRRADGAHHGREQARQVEGFGDVVEGSVAHRRDGPRSVVVSRRDDHRDVAERALPELTEEVEAVAVAQAYVQENT